MYAPTLHFTFHIASLSIYLFIYYESILLLLRVYRNGPNPWPKFLFFIFFVLVIFFSFVVGSLFSQTLAPLLSNESNQPRPTSNYPTQKLNKNNKSIYNDNCNLANKKKKTILPPKNQKTMLLEKLKLNFFCNYSKLV